MDLDDEEQNEQQELHDGDKVEILNAYLYNLIYLLDSEVLSVNDREDTKKRVKQIIAKIDKYVNKLC